MCRSTLTGRWKSPVDCLLTSRTATPQLVLQSPSMAQLASTASSTFLDLRYSGVAPCDQTVPRRDSFMSTAVRTPITQDSDASLVSSPATMRNSGSTRPTHDGCSELYGCSFVAWRLKRGRSAFSVQVCDTLHDDSLRTS